ncbi:Thermosensitive gluconokinase [Magnetospira sp. QH-2]|nr:Thermosensitive gluconokinase [Magnetospira sp. QH-2]
MGVSGSGKSTIGEALAARLGLPFLDADDYHPPANVDKMSQGIPLTDADRWPWLKSLGLAMNDAAAKAGGVIATCSALKRVYRTTLSGQVGLPLIYVLLDGDRDTLFARMNARKDHYMPPSLLDSQLAALERPETDEPALTCAIDRPVAEIIDEIAVTLDEWTDPGS